jgi:hypothetical protein
MRDLVSISMNRQSVWLSGQRVLPGASRHRTCGLPFNTPAMAARCGQRHSRLRGCDV